MDRKTLLRRMNEHNTMMLLCPQLCAGRALDVPEVYSGTVMEFDIREKHERLDPAIYSLVEKIRHSRRWYSMPNLGREIFFVLINYSRNVSWCAIWYV